MHVIPISCDGECSEWTMIEMQGELERKGPGDPEQEFPIGQLKLSTSVRACSSDCAAPHPSLLGSSKVFAGRVIIDTCKLN